jgi:outer membrane protein OmpA-like peptidoglycan-associated protein
MPRTLRVLIQVLCLSLLARAGIAQDAEGCKDPPLVSRMPGFNIVRCTLHDFGSHAFGTGKSGEVTVEGRYTEIMYGIKEGSKEPSRLQIQRNYENALTKIGGTVSGRDDDGNVYLKAAREGKEIWVHLNAYITSQYSVVVVEKAAMAQDVVADAAALAGGIKAEGKIAVYGITFDTGKATLKPASEPTLLEIAKLLKAQPALKLYVVGHTDNVAALELNLKLSQARAEAVVQALVSKHGIAANRLKAHGVGPLCPVASNDAEPGRAKNRRVELAKQ